MATTVEILVLVVAILGNVLSGLTFFAPVRTFRTIRREKSTLEFEPTPYLVAVCSCILWLYYGIITKNVVISIINGIGLVIEGMYIFMYMYYATNDVRNKIGKVLGYGAAVYVVFVTLTLTLTFGYGRDGVVGVVCMAFSIMVFASPLVSVIQVIKTKDVKYMPFLLSLSLTVNAIVWFLYGFLKKDPEIAIPNIFGFVLGLVQVTVYWIYRKAKPQTTT